MSDLFKKAQTEGNNAHAPFLIFKFWATLTRRSEGIFWEFNVQQPSQKAIYAEVFLPTSFNRNLLKDG
jgi:hypothetical protein